MPHPEVPGPDPQRGGQSEQVRANPLSARVPDRVSRGVFSTGVIVMTGGTEFILDFLLTLGKPRQVAARIVMPHATLPQFVEALKQNLEMYKQRFGPPQEPPRPPADERRPTVQEIYDELKLPDDVLSGSYANGVMISHGPSEFSFDFLTNFFPHSAISARVYMSASQAPRVLESLQATFTQFQQRLREQQQQPPRDSNPPPAE